MARYNTFIWGTVCGALVMLLVISFDGGLVNCLVGDYYG